MKKEASDLFRKLGITVDLSTADEEDVCFKETDV